MTREPITTAPSPRRIGSQRDVLGESPVWSVGEQALYWVDIRKPTIRRYRPADESVESWALPEMVGAIGLCGGGRLVVGLGSRIALFDTATKAFETIAELPERRPGHRFNDGRCDPAGRFWISTMHNDTRGPEGTLYRLCAKERELRLEPVLERIRIPNSLCWSPDGRTMYFADSLDHAIGAYDFDPATGALGARRDFARTHPPAFPDGSAIDARGRVWNAEFDGGRVSCWEPHGRFVSALQVPVQRPTSCAFGGPNLDVLYVTTTCQHMTEADRAAAPLTGALLAFELGVRGLPEPLFDQTGIKVTR